MSEQLVTDYHITDLHPSRGYTGRALAVGGPCHGMVIVFSATPLQTIQFGDQPTVTIQVPNDPSAEDTYYTDYEVSPLERGGVQINGVTLTHEAVVVKPDPSV